MNQLLAMRAFLRVVETGTFGHAADQLGVPRSTVSKLIADLEAHLGVQLMHRTTRRLSVTAEGQEYYQSAARLVVELDAADGAVRGRKLKPHGHVRIDAPTSFANCLLIPALPDFHQQYPDVTLAIGIDDRPVNIVGEGVDCAIRAGELRDLGLVARRIAEIRLCDLRVARLPEPQGHPRVARWPGARTCADRPFLGGHRQAAAAAVRTRRRTP